METEMDKTSSGKKEYVPTDRKKSEMRVYYGPSQDTVLFGFSVDVSSGGLFLKTECQLETDEKLVLSFSLPDDERMITCSARVAWVNDVHNPRKPELPAGVGVQFVDLSLEEMKTIKSFLEDKNVEPKW